MGQQSVGERGQGLPLPLTPFIGRRHELGELQRLLETSRLVTVTGAGGAGKTRLALQAANAASERFPGGLWLAPLESIADPDLVPGVVAARIGVREEPARPLADTLAAYLRPRRALIILDNCEHLTRACGVLAESLLQLCPELRILATSRQPLGVGGETTWRIPALAMPDSTPLPPIERLRQVDSVRLFAERAAAARPGFGLSEANARAVVELCRRLDGMPLALELAAARVRLLGVEQIVHRLDDRLRLLTGGSATAMPRQQTLAATLEWSHDLLSEAERILLRRVSVFAGGWTLEVAEAVCAAEDDASPSLGSGPRSRDVLNLLGGLVDKSLVVADEQTDGVMRYRLLETVRQYAANKLRAASEEECMRERHAGWIFAFVQRLGPSANGLDTASALQRLLPELDNLRAALDWAASKGVNAEPALRACAAAYRLWLVYGFLGEGRQRLLRLAQTATAPTAEAWRAYAFFGAATLAMFQGNYTGARALMEQSLEMARAAGNRFLTSECMTVLALLQLNAGESNPAWVLLQENLALCRKRVYTPDDEQDPPGAELACSLYGDAWRPAVLGHTLMIAGVAARVRGNHARAAEFYEESLALLEQQGDTWFIAQVLSDRGLLALDQGEPARARTLFEQALALRQGLGDRTGIARSLHDIGRVAWAEGALDDAQASHTEGLRIVRELGDRSGIADALVALGRIAHARGDGHAARRYLIESLTIRKELGHRLAVPGALEDLAELAAANGDPARAIRLAGAAATMREQLRSSDVESEEPRPKAAYTAALDAAASAAAWSEGRGMSPDEAVAYALEQPQVDSAAAPRRRARSAHAPLSDRELSVAKLIALGRTNREIAAELVIAEGTADRHVSNILGKLGLGARAQVALWIAERSLLHASARDTG